MAKDSIVPRGVIAMIRKKIVPKIIQPKNIQQQRITQQHDEMTVKAEEERLAAEKAEQTKRLAAEKAEEERLAAEKAEQVQLRIQSLEERLQSLVDTSTFVDEVFAEMEEKEIVHVPTIVNHHRHNHEQVEQIVHESKIIQQEKIIQQMDEVPKIIGLRLPFSPMDRAIYLSYGVVLHSNRW